jgi:hypothetical protein
VSFYALQAAALVDVGPDGHNLNPTAILVMFRLAHHHNHSSGKCYPAQATLAEGCNASVRAVQMGLAQLEQEGLIAILPGAASGIVRGRPSDNYTLLFVRHMRVKFPACFRRKGGDEIGATVSEIGASIAPQQRKGTEESTKEESPKPPRGPRPKSEASPEAIALAKDIWAETPKVARGRSSESDLALAVHKALARGAAAARLRGALLAHYASPDVAKDDHAFAKGVHRMVERDRWREWDPGPDAAPLPAPRPAANDAHPAGGGKPELPMQMQRGWMRDWVEGGEGKWLFHRRDEPMPGQPGCRVSDAVQLMFGVEPWAPPAEARG